MNKFIKSLFFIIISLFPIMVLAKENISIESIKVIDKTGYTEELSSPKVKDLNINTNIKFYNLNDSITYRVNINNKDNKKYSVKLDTSTNKYITYSVKKSDSNKYLDITIKYINEITDNKYNGNDNIKLKLVNSGNILVNPLTNSEKSHLLVLVIIGVGIILLLKKKQYKNISLLLALILIPSIVNATNDILEINLNNNITIEKVMLEKGEQFNKDITTLAGDSNPTYTENTSIKAIKVVNTLPNNVKTIDVSETKDESIKAYFDNGTIYLYTMLSKVILNKNLSYLFYNLTKVTEIDTKNFDTSKVTDMSFMFYKCRSLTSLDLSKFDTSNVTNMGNMFSGCSSLTSLDLSKFDTSKVTNMSDMFYACSSLTSLDVSKFDTSNVTNMSWMFVDCSSLTSLDVSNFDTSNVTDMSFMFSSCSSLTNLDVSKFDTSKVTNMSDMFYACSSLTSLDVSNFDTSNVTNMYMMFCDCRSLTSLDVSKFDTSKVTDMSLMFFNCSSLTSLDVSNFDTTKVTDMRAMFCNCSSLTNLDVSKFDTSNVTNMGNMFDSCSKLKTIYASNKFDTSKVSKYSYMFSNCTSLVGGNGTTYSSSYTDKTYARIDSSSTPGYFTSKA